jgi:hypothetical protein
MATPSFPSPVLPFPSPRTFLIAADVLDTNVYTALHDTHSYTHTHAHTLLITPRDVFLDMGGTLHVNLPFVGLSLLSRCLIFLAFGNVLLLRRLFYLSYLPLLPPLTTLLSFLWK